jgi:hypothetical protein
MPRTNLRSKKERDRERAQCCIVYMQHTRPIAWHDARLSRLNVAVYMQDTSWMPRMNLRSKKETDRERESSMLHSLHAAYTPNRLARCSVIAAQCCSLYMQHTNKIFPYFRHCSMKFLHIIYAAYVHAQSLGTMLGYRGSMLHSLYAAYNKNIPVDFRHCSMM